MNPPADLLSSAQQVLRFSTAPFSHFNVAASIRAINGAIFSGCNIEFAALPLSLRAETSAISSLFSHGQSHITEALVLVTHQKICSPCGACRQRLFECAASDIDIHLCTTQGDYRRVKIRELLPFAFDHHNLE